MRFLLPSSDQGRDIAEDDGVRKRRKMIFEMGGPLAPADMGGVDLDERLWRDLPEDILGAVISRLPLAARCRFRCVQRKWKVDKSTLALPCTIVSRMGDSIAKYYCQSEEKWFDLPSNKHLPPSLSWELEDVDSGLVCYQGKEKDDWYSFWVCNPLQFFTTSWLIRPTFPRRDPLLFRPDRPVTKLLVDRAKHTFKLISIVDKVGLTAVFESSTADWEFHNDSPGFDPPGLLAWGNGVYAYNFKQTLGMKRLDRQRRLAAAFESGDWVDVEMELPLKFNFEARHCFLSDTKHLMIVFSSPGNGEHPCFSILKLWDKRSRTMVRGSIPKWWKWENISIDSESARMDLAGHRLAHACYAAAHIWFTFIDDRIGENGLCSWVCKCVRYSFATKTWSVVPWPGAGGEGKMFSWKGRVESFRVGFRKRPSNGNMHVIY